MKRLGLPGSVAAAAGILAVGFLIAYAGYWLTLPMVRMRPEGQLPDREIAFFDSSAEDTLGFIDPDGSGYETRRLSVVRSRFRDLVPLVTWSSDGEYLATGFEGEGCVCPPFRVCACGPFWSPVLISPSGEILTCPDDSIPLIDE